MSFEAFIVPSSHALSSKVLQRVEILFIIPWHEENETALLILSSGGHSCRTDGILVCLQVHWFLAIY